MFDFAFKRAWRARLKDAAIWQLKIEEDQRVRASPEFQNWLQNDSNWRAFARVAGAWRSIESHSEAAAIKAIANNAINRLHRNRRHNFPSQVWVGAACALVGFLAVGTYFVLRIPPDRPIVYASDSKGLRIVKLDDGSQIWLDASSSLTVHSFTSTSRRITLNSGRAQFNVAHDTGRPFSVTAANEVATAVGTSFVVERLRGELLVTVTQGRVLEESVKSGSPSHRAVSLTKGQQLVAKSSGHISVSEIDVDTTSAWQKGRIVVDDQPLSEAIERLNRYLNKKIVVDPAVANIKISGVFSEGDLSTFLKALAKTFPVDAEQQNNGTTVLHARPTPD